MTIESQKKFKAVRQISKCMEGTAIQCPGSYIEKVGCKYITKESSPTLHLPSVKTEAAKGSYIGFKVRLAATKSQLASKTENYRR